MNDNSSLKIVTSGEIKISCTTCNFEGRWHKGIGPAYTPEDGCHKSIISSGWCDSCKTITTQYAGQAGTCDLSDYGVQNKYEHHGPPDTDRGILGTLDGGGLPWAGAEWRLKELKSEVSRLERAGVEVHHVGGVLEVLQEVVFPIVFGLGGVKVRVRVAASKLPFSTSPRTDKNNGVLAQLGDFSTAPQNRLKRVTLTLRTSGRGASGRGGCRVAGAAGRSR